MSEYTSNFSISPLSLIPPKCFDNLPNTLVVNHDVQQCSYFSLLRKAFVGENEFCFNCLGVQSVNCLLPKATGIYLVYVAKVPFCVTQSILAALLIYFKGT